MMNEKRCLGFVVLLCLLVGCRTGQPAPEPLSPEATEPTPVEDAPAAEPSSPTAEAASPWATTSPAFDWPVVSLSEVGLDEERVRTAVARIEDQTYENIHSLLIVRDGKLAFEAYFQGYTWNYNGDQYRGDLIFFTRDTPHNLASVTKSVTSILLGIAMDQGAIAGVDEKLFTYFPQYAHLEDERKEGLTLEHLLTMSSGMEWNESDLSYGNAENDLVRLFSVPDPIDYILAKPLIHDPGMVFNYNGGNTNLLGEVIRATTGQRMDAFAQEYLFGPLDITNYEWDFINPDMIHASGNLRLCPRDMAKLGQLYLNGGVWEGQRIVSEAWAAESTREHIHHSADSGYGYQWWLRTYHAGALDVEAFCALGWGGQKIIAMPALDMVVVFTGGNYASADPGDEILTRYILPAVQR